MEHLHHHHIHSHLWCSCKKINNSVIIKKINNIDNNDKSKWKKNNLSFRFSVLPNAYKHLKIWDLIICKTNWKLLLIKIIIYVRSIIINYIFQDKFVLWFANMDSFPMEVKSCKTLWSFKSKCYEHFTTINLLYFRCK